MWIDMEAVAYFVIVLFILALVDDYLRFDPNA